MNWTPASIDVSPDSSLVVELSHAARLTPNWQQKLIAAAELNPSKAAFVWNDLIWRRFSYGRLGFFRVKWPPSDPYLIQQTDCRSRCAIRGSLLGELAELKAISSPTDTSGALCWLTRERPRAIGSIADVMRYTRSEESEVYKPLLAKAPQSPKDVKCISVIINYRDKVELMEPCLISLANQKIESNLEVLLVDNQSSSASRKQVEELAEKLLSRASVRHLTYDYSFNHSGQNNMAVKLAEGEVTVLLNNDVLLIDPECVQTISKWALVDGVASAGPRILDRTGKTVSNGVLIRAPIRNESALIQENDCSVHAHVIRRTGGNSFCCAAVSKAAWSQVGPLDEECFKTQYNDADFFVRALQAGMQHIHVGTVACQHQPGGTEHRSIESTAHLLDRFRRRYPDLGDYSDVDIDIIALAPLEGFRVAPLGFDKFAVPSYQLARSLLIKSLRLARRWIG